MLLRDSACMKAASPAQHGSNRIDRLLASAPKPAAEILQRCLEEPLQPVGKLQNHIRDYLHTLTSIAADAEFIDLETARRTGARCEALLAGLDASDPEAHQLVQLAILYFIEDDDAEGDTTSPIGFDDDAEVVALVARELDREDIPMISGDET